MGAVGGESKRRRGRQRAGCAAQQGDSWPLVTGPSHSRARPAVSFPPSLSCCSCCGSRVRKRRGERGALQWEGEVASPEKTKIVWSMYRGPCDYVLETRRDAKAEQLSHPKEGTVDCLSYRKGLNPKPRAPPRASAWLQGPDPC